MIKVETVKKLFGRTSVFIIAFLIISTTSNLIYLSRNTGKAKGDEGWTGQPDFKVFWIAARNLTQRVSQLRETQDYKRKDEIRNLYPVYDKKENFYHFRYSPTVAFLMIPFSELYYPRSALFWWSNLLILAFLTALFLLKKQISRDFKLTKFQEALILWGAFLATLRYYLMILGQGQTDVFTALFFVLFLMTYLRKKDILSGIMLALIFQIKPFFLPILFYFLIKGKMKIVLSCVAAFVGFLFLPCFIVGLSETMLLLKEWKEILSMSIPSQLFNVKNQSVPSFVSGFLLKGNFINRSLSVETLTYSIATILTVSFYLPFVWYGKFVRAGNEIKHKYLEISLLIVTAVLFSPIAWQAYFVNIIISFAFMLYLFIASDKKSLPFAAMAIYFILSCMVGTDITKFIPGVNSMHFINITLGTVFMVFALLYSYHRTQIKHNRI